MRDRLEVSHLGIQDANEVPLLQLREQDTHSLCLLMFEAQAMTHWHRQDMAIAVGVGEVMFWRWMSCLVAKDLQADGCHVNESYSVACLQHPSVKEGGTRGYLKCRRIEVGEERWL